MTEDRFACEQVSLRRVCLPTEKHTKVNIWVQTPGERQVENKFEKNQENERTQEKSTSVVEEI